MSTVFTPPPLSLPIQSSYSKAVALSNAIYYRRGLGINIITLWQMTIIRFNGQQENPCASKIHSLPSCLMYGTLKDDNLDLRLNMKTDNFHYVVHALLCVRRCHCGQMRHLLRACSLDNGFRQIIEIDRKVMLQQRMGVY